MELLVVISIIALLMSILIPSLQKARENAKRVVCKSNLKQFGLLLHFYCEDNNGRYPPPRSTNYPWTADFRPAFNQMGLLALIPYIYNIGSLETAKSQGGVDRMKVFWWPSGTVKYDPLKWKSSAFAEFGYNQYCGRSAATSIIGNQSRAPIWQSINSPMKNIRSRGNQITISDVSIWGHPRMYGYYARNVYLRSNHPSTISRSGPGGLVKEHFAAGMNSAHVDGHVEWIRPQKDFSNTVRIWMNGLVMGTATDEPSYWLFPKIF